MKVDAVDQQLVDDTERWLCRRGVPTLVRKRRALYEVWSSARWWLIAIIAFDVLAAFNERFQGWSQFFVFAGTIIVSIGVVAAFNILRGRRPFEAPNSLAWPELAFFLLFPTVLAGIVSADPLIGAITAFVSHALVLLLVWLLVAVGLGWIIRWSFRAVRRHVFDIARLVARSVPLLLLLTVFMFINAEAWQVANGMEPRARPFIFFGIIAVAAAFMWFAADELTDDAAVSNNFAEAVRRAHDSPLGTLDRRQECDLPHAELSRSARINLRLLLVVSVAVQAFLVSVLLMFVYLVLGMVLVPPAVLSAWLAVPLDQVPVAWDMNEIGINAKMYEAHIIVPTAVALLAGLNITVASLTDDAYRRTFADGLLTEINEDLAVHRLLIAVEHQQLPTDDTGDR